MLRVLSSKIFRENLREYALPMWAFENFDDVVNIIDMNNDTYKFCLPVSIGDFAETNVPACFSNNIEELRKFVETQICLNKRKAFIISDFLVSDLSQVCFSGIIITQSKKGIGNFMDKTTNINITFKNPILTYAQEGISPRDLPADVELSYSHILEPTHAFPQVNIKNNILPMPQYKDIVYQAYIASTKIHEIAEIYDGQEYIEYTLFCVDNQNKVRLYEIIGADSFLKKAKCDKKIIRTELDLITQSSNINYTNIKEQEKTLKKTLTKK